MPFPKPRSLPLFLFVLLLATAWKQAFSSFMSCDHWFERDVLCDSIDVQKEWTMKFQEKDLTYCPDKCQSCKNYDSLEPINQNNFNTTSFNADDNFQYYNNWTIYNNTGYKEDRYTDEDEYHYKQQMIFYDQDGNPLSTMPWEMQYFYEYAHCARDSKVTNIWKTGDNNKMYERIVRSFPEYSPKVLSRPEDSVYATEKQDSNTSIGVGPWLVKLENFLTDEECDAMIEETEIAIAESGGDHSLEVSETGQVYQSTQAWCDADDCMKKPLMKQVWNKIEKLVDLPFATHAESPHFIRYIPGKIYGEYTDDVISAALNSDAISAELNSVMGPRIFTLLYYLNDVDEGNGGETCFPQIKRADGVPREPICVTPRKGQALLWPNILDEIPNDVEILENRTWHVANGITEGYKYAGTVWYHLRNFSYAQEIDCQEIYDDNFDFDWEYYLGNDSEDYFDDDYLGEGGYYINDSYDEDETNLPYSADDDEYHYFDYYGNVIQTTTLANARHLKNSDNFYSHDKYDDLPIGEWN